MRFQVIINTSMYPPDSNIIERFMKKKPGVDKVDFGIVIGLSIILYLALLAVVIYFNAEATKWVISLLG